MRETVGVKLAAWIGKRIGSWGFISVQTTFLIVYLLINGTALLESFTRPFDPFPFVFLNLMLSFQAAYTGPILLISQNAQAARDGKLQEQMRKLMESSYLMLQRMDARDDRDQRLLTAIQTTLLQQQTIMRTLELLMRRMAGELEIFVATEDRPNENAQHAALKKGEWT